MSRDRLKILLKTEIYTHVTSQIPNVFGNFGYRRHLGFWFLTLFESWIWLLLGALIFLFLLFSDVDECAAAKKPCIKENERCKNTAGSYKCECRSGFKREGDKCVKKKGKKKKSVTKSEEDLLADELEKGNYYSEAQMKIGSVLYAIFFGCLVVAIMKKKVWALVGLSFFYACVLWYMRQPKNTRWYFHFSVFIKVLGIFFMLNGEVSCWFLSVATETLGLVLRPHRRRPKLVLTGTSILLYLVWCCSRFFTWQTPSCHLSWLEFLESSCEGVKGPGALRVPSIDRSSPNFSKRPHTDEMRELITRSNLIFDGISASKSSLRKTHYWFWFVERSLLLVTIVVLCCVVLCCVVLCFAVLCCVVLCCVWLRLYTQCACAHQRLISAVDSLFEIFPTKQGLTQRDRIDLQSEILACFTGKTIIPKS